MAIKVKTILAYEEGNRLFQKKDYDGAFREYLRSARDGHEDSAIMLAEMYYYGKGVKRNRDTAFKYYQDTGETYLRSSFMLAYCYTTGIGVRANEKKARKWLDIALGKSEAVSQCAEFAFNYYYGKKGFFVDYDKAFYLFGIAAERGNAMAITNLAQCYEKGNGCPIDLNKAKELYQKAMSTEYIPAFLKMAAMYRTNRDAGINYDMALSIYERAQALGSDEAQNQIESIYSKGFYVPPDARERVKTVYAEALDGNPAAMYDIGNLYQTGKYFKVNYPLAGKWLTKAAEAGNTSAMVSLGIAYSKGEGVRPDQVKAIEFYKRAAEAGDKFGQFNLGMCYRYGKGVPRDFDEAFYWFSHAAALGHKQALDLAEACIAEKKGIDPNRSDIVDYLNGAEKNDPVSQYKLGMAYLTGDGATQEFQEAFNWFLRAADQGNADAAFEIGCYYYSGKRGVARNPEKAVRYFLEAAKRNHCEATFNLGVCYYNGVGVDKNEDIAVRLFKKAVTLGSASAEKILADLAKKL